MPQIVLPKAHPGQARIWRNAKRFNVVNCGRRFGKTDFGKTRLLAGSKGAFAGYPVAWFAPSYKYLADVWRSMLTTLQPAIVEKNRTEWRIGLTTGGVIDFWTLDDPDAGRGRKYGRIVVDEAAKCRYLEQAWNESIRPTLSDYQGEADFLSTPKGRNYYATLYERGDPGSHAYRAGWASFRMPTSSNPYIRKSEIEEARLDLPDLVFRQEYEAEFVDFAGTAVKREWLEYGDPFRKWPRSLLRIGVGVDLAISQRETADWTALVVVAIDPDGHVWIIHTERARLTFNQTLEAIKRVAEATDADIVGVEQVQYQAAVVQELLRTTSLPVRGLDAERDKLTRFLPLQTRFERHMVHLDEYLPAVFEGELLSFPEGDHDDQVDALVHAYAAASAIGMGQTVEGVGGRVHGTAGVVHDDDGSFGSVSLR